MADISAARRHIVFSNANGKTGKTWCGRWRRQSNEGGRLPECEICRFAMELETAEGPGLELIDEMRGKIVRSRFQTVVDELAWICVMNQLDLEKIAKVAMNTAISMKVAPSKEDAEQALQATRTIFELAGTGSIAPGDIYVLDAREQWRRSGL